MREDNVHRGVGPLQYGAGPRSAARSGRGAAACLISISFILAGCSAVPGGPAPTRTASGNAEMASWVTSVASCLQDEGWSDVHATSDGAGLNVGSLPADQIDQFRAARERCERAAGDQPNAAELSTTQLTALYEHLVDSVSCIESHGYSVLNPPPSREVFVDQYLAGTEPWSPFIGLPDSMTEAEWAALNQDCPQAP